MITIQDAAGVRIVHATETIAASQFDAETGAPFQYRLPLGALTGSGPRDYLLTFEAAADRAVVRRDVAFQVAR